MPTAPAATHEAPAAPAQTRSRGFGTAPARPGQPSPYSESHRPTDDEILGLDSAHTATAPEADNTAETNRDTVGAGFKPAPTNPEDDDSAALPENLRAALDANPELRRAWQDAQSYRETFSTPEEARAATALLSDLDRMDALFFSRRPEDHAELARAVAALDPAAFASLAQAMNGLATEALSHRENRAGNPSSSSAPRTRPVIPNAPAQSGAEESAVGSEVQNQIPRRPQDGLTRDDNVQEGLPGRRLAEPGRSDGTAPSQAQAEFFHATNAAAVEGVLDVIESQVERLLPDGVSKSARNRMVGEIYRELDTTLRSNRQLSQQMRDAFRSGSLDAEHERAIVSLITGRARQALPGVAKRVLNEWTSTVVAANHDRRARQRAAERRVDIAGSSGGGNDGSRSMGPRDVDYARMSDSDILNL
ncbi:MAG TPA: hypothetical protein VN822_00730 [Candidatus Acidoferrales bacterium]|nr:hypothetical protein [Candidatus Acidoferrales bacterium]